MGIRWPLGGLNKFDLFAYFASKICCVDVFSLEVSVMLVAGL